MSDPEKMKVAELRAVLQERGLDTKGTKPVLVSRLLGEDGEKMEPSPSTPRKRRLSSSSRPSTPVRRSRRISGDLESAQVIAAATNNIETIAEDGEEEKSGDTACDDKNIPDANASPLPSAADLAQKTINRTEDEVKEQAMKVAETTAAAIAPNLTRQPEPRFRTQKKSYDCVDDSVHGCKYGGDS